MIHTEYGWVDFLQRCVLHAIEFQAQQPGRVLGDKLNRFKDLVIQDSTIIINCFNPQNPDKIHFRFYLRNLRVSAITYRYL